MSFYQRGGSLSRRFRSVFLGFLQAPGLAFSKLLPEEEIQRVFEEEGCTFAQEEGEVYTPALTLWAFLSQVLFKEEQRSCVAAVSRVIVLLVAMEQPSCSSNTGAYCKARAKLSERVLERLTYDVADRCEAAIPREWLWYGRHVKLIDGTTVSMPDTAANQNEYPQNPTQEEGLGFPIARLVVLLSFATAMVTGMAMGAYSGKETGESALLRQLFERLQAGDIVLADRYYSSYFMICLLRELGVDIVSRLHQQRTADFRRGQRLNAGDHIVEWERPAKPEWMDQATYERMPETLSIREVEVAIVQPGFRVNKIVVVTTLTDARLYTRYALADLYHERWLVELDIRSIKCTLGIDVLRCKTPEMVRKEIWTALIAYNLIRQSILEAAKKAGLAPRDLSFTAAMQKIAASYVSLPMLNAELAATMIETHLADLAKHIVGDRPNRVEPRAVKRRPKPHALLKKPRAEAKAELLAGKA